MLKVVLLCMAVFLMEAAGARYIGNHLDRDKKSLVVLGIMFLLGMALSAVLVVRYPEHIFIHDLRLAVLYGMLCPVAVIDFRIQKIPNELLILTAVIWGLTVAAEVWKNPELVWDDTKSSVVAAVSVFIVCMICKLLIKNSIGMGDIKLFMVMGLMQGLVGMSGAVFTSLIVAFFGAVVLMAVRKKGRKDQISFGPFILIGTTISMFMTGL